jgi:hypothetical protein
MSPGNYKENSTDIFGDMCEILTRIAVAGKAEVNKVGDPACGMGGQSLFRLKRRFWNTKKDKKMG